MGRVLTADEARKLNAARKVQAGPVGVTMRCGWCGREQTASQMRRHFTDCALKPKPAEELTIIR